MDSRDCCSCTADLQQFRRQSCSFQDRADFFNEAPALLLDGVTIRRANEKNGKLLFYPLPE
jgi:hypothetical protein